MGDLRALGETHPRCPGNGAVEFDSAGGHHVADAVSFGTSASEFGASTRMPLCADAVSVISLDNVLAATGGQLDARAARPDRTPS